VENILHPLTIDRIFSTVSNMAISKDKIKRHDAMKGPLDEDLDLAR
jgi:hypothetical protein